MKIEIHILQNFAPSCLNRDDVNAPKSCTFGNVVRARISSQSYKRAVRDNDEFHALVKGRGIAVRTRHLVSEIARLVDETPPEAQPSDKTLKHVIALFTEAGLLKKRERGSKDEDGEGEDQTGGSETGLSKVLVFMDEEKVHHMADAIRTAVGTGSVNDAETIAALCDFLADSARVPEIALFGRMLEVNPKSPFGKLSLRVDAACQVAHAISTHAVDTETDFFTAVDDLTRDRGEIGAGMMGTQGFNSACFYRYALLDREQLVRNLGGDRNAASDSIEAFLHAFTLAIPTAKQNSHAAQNLPSFALFVAREKGAPVSLANAFARPIAGEDLVGASINQLCRYQGRMQELYGLYSDATMALFHDRIENKLLAGLASNEVPGIQDAVAAIMARVRQ